MSVNLYQLRSWEWQNYSDVGPNNFIYNEHYKVESCDIDFTFWVDWQDNYGDSKEESEKLEEVLRVAEEAKEIVWTLGKFFSGDCDDSVKASKAQDKCIEFYKKSLEDNEGGE